MITSTWIDTETTGIDPRDSGAFEIALLIYKGAERVLEKFYHLNPLGDEVNWSAEACHVNGVSEETILSYPPPAEVVPEFAADLGCLIDLDELVKRAADAGLIEKTQDQKLGTMAKALNIVHNTAHTAMDDIKAARRLYETIYYLEKRRS